MRRLLRYLARLLLGLLVLAAGGLAWAHYAIRQERAPLPSFDAIDAAAAAGGDLPVQLSIINTASQPMPRGGVLDPGGDPRPQEPYVMSHPAFVLRWADGRILLVDVGMTPQQAVEFGKPVELLAGAQPTQAHGSTADQLGAAAKQVNGVVFTHTHSDHVGGIGALCLAAGHPIPAFMTLAQAQRPNYTTRPGLSAIAESGCAQPTGLGEAALKPVPGFPGAYVIDAGGHTPGSEIVLAFVQDAAGVHRYAFTGDIVNNLDGILADVPKPLVYRTVLIPEDGDRQAELRHFLKRLREQHQFTLLVSHDQRALQASGVPNYAGVTGDQ
ncbi:MAG: MBL fold metallo-hydrolase [Deltaproteobacteria bacterium]|nr:MBL fold metallo-hydrolase [Deltaproteobacteria bacterium]